MEIYKARYITLGEKTEPKSEVTPEEIEKENEAVRKYLDALKQPCEKTLNHQGIIITPTETDKDNNEAS